MKIIASTLQFLRTCAWFRCTSNTHRQSKRSSTWLEDISKASNSIYRLKSGNFNCTFLFNLFFIFVVEFQDSCLQLWGFDFVCSALPWNPHFCSNSSVNWYRVLSLCDLTVYYTYTYISHLIYVFWTFSYPILRNTKWKFLNGVKLSGAPPPRTVIVDQCQRDKGVLEALCNYVSVCIYPILFYYAVCRNGFGMGLSFFVRLHLQRSYIHHGQWSAFVQPLLLRF